jgi:hypothetical protein
LKIYLICPVRRCGEEEKKLLYGYVDKLETAGNKVFYADRDVNQNDPTGLGIVTAERSAILEADEIHVWWKQRSDGSSESEGSVFDFGMTWMAIAFMPDKKIVIANPNMVYAPSHKSYTTVLMLLDAADSLKKRVVKND